MTDKQPIDQDAVKLVPCPNPWCGPRVEPMPFSMRGGFHQVICGCDFKGPRAATREAAIAAWNRRATPPVREGEAEMREKVDGAVSGVLYGYDGRLLSGEFWPGHDAIVDAITAALTGRGKGDE